MALMGEIRRRAWRGMTDGTSTVEALRARVAEFVHARDWERFHRPANLAKAISVEAAELLELFQWRAEDDDLQRGRPRNLSERLFRFPLGARVEILRRRRILLGPWPPGVLLAMHFGSADEHEAAHACACRGPGEMNGRLKVYCPDLRHLVEPGSAGGVRTSGEVHDGIHAGDRRGPVRRRPELIDFHNLDVGGQRSRAPYGRAHREAAAAQQRAERATDETRCSGDENLHLAAAS